MAQATLLVRHQVEDYAAWRAVYDSVEPLRTEHGCTDAEVLVDPVDKQDVLVLLCHLHYGGNLLADAGGDHRATQHGAARGHMRLSAKRNNLVVAYMPHECDVVIFRHTNRGLTVRLSAFLTLQQTGEERNQVFRYNGLGLGPGLPILDAPMPT